MASVQIITGRERRWSWSEGQKRAIVAAAFAPGAIVADVARRAEICAGQIYRWRQEIRQAERGFAEVVIAAVDDVAMKAPHWVWLRRSRSSLPARLGCASRH